MSVRARAMFEEGELADQVGKKHLGWSCPANPALIVPVPWRRETRAARAVSEGEGSEGRKGRRVSSHVVDHDRVVEQHILKLG